MSEFDASSPDASSYEASVSGRTTCPKGHEVKFSSPSCPEGTPRFWSTLRLPGDPLIQRSNEPATDQQPAELQGFGYQCPACSRLYWCRDGISLLPSPIQIVAAFTSFRIASPNLHHGYVMAMDVAIFASCLALLEERFNRFRVDRKLEG